MGCYLVLYYPFLPSPVQILTNQLSCPSKIWSTIACVLTVVPGVDWELRAAARGKPHKMGHFLSFPIQLIKQPSPRIMTPKQAARVINTTIPLWPVCPHVCLPAS